MKNALVKTNLDYVIVLYSKEYSFVTEGIVSLFVLL